MSTDDKTGDAVPKRYRLEASRNGADWGTLSPFDDLGRAVKMGQGLAFCEGARIIDNADGEVVWSSDQ